MSEESTGESRPGVSSWVKAVMAAGAVLLLGLVLLVGVLLGRGSGGEEVPESSASASESPKTFTVYGQLALTDSSGFVRAGGECIGYEGYDDIEGGAQVVIRNATGESVAVGSLEPGRPAQGSCIFAFTVEHVPSGSSLYSVEVGHRGEVTFTEDEAADLSLTIG